MEERTSLANKILSAEERIRCDTACKKILAEKCRILEENYHIPMTTSIESEVSTMCNFSEGFFERGLEKGMLEGEARGEARGEVTGRLHTLYDLALSGIITLSIAAQQAGQTEEEFTAGLDAYRGSLKKTVNA